MKSIIVEDQFFRGKCLFCGNEASEEMFSGSYQTYIVCNCARSVEYFKNLDTLEKSAAIAHRRKEKMMLEEEIERLKNSLGRAQKDMRNIKL